MQQVEKVKRNRAKTTQRIVDALEEVLAERGLEGVGVNRIAEKANVSKVLIYRYFGGIEGLLDYYVKMGKAFSRFYSDDVGSDSSTPRVRYGPHLVPAGYSDLSPLPDLQTSP